LSNHDDLDFRRGISGPIELNGLKSTPHRANQEVRMSLTKLHDRTQIAAFLQQDPPLYLYSLGDLDDFFFPLTQWYAWRTPSMGTAALAMLYAGFQPHILHAICPAENLPAMRLLLEELYPVLPAQIYAHFSPGLQDTLKSHFQIYPEGRHWKMTLTRPELLPTTAANQVRKLSSGDLPALGQLYQHSYPNNDFDTRLLETGQYFGLYLQGKLVCSAGIHVYSPQYGVAAIGNVVTHRDYRSRGYARETVAVLCRSLQQTVSLIGLNVKADNYPAIHLYQGLGFTYSVEYDECTLVKT
jgi:RimJ/RimL family protein N-acetyltransferase